jgi:hypothetical protein
VNYSYAACRHRVGGQNTIVLMGPGLLYKTPPDLLSECVVYSVCSTIEEAENWFSPKTASIKQEDEPVVDFRRKCSEFLRRSGITESDVFNIEEIDNLGLIVGRVHVDDLEEAGIIVYNVDRKTIGFV